jgi:hypothetical protein
MIPWFSTLRVPGSKVAGKHSPEVYYAKKIWKILRIENKFVCNGNQC